MVEPLPDKEEKNPFENFQNSQRVYCLTGLFIQSLWKKVEGDMGEEYCEERPGKSETWKQAVTEWIQGVFPDAVRGKLFYEHGEYDKALDAYQQALAIRRKVLGEEHPSTATSYNNLGAVYDSKGEYSQAIEYYQKDLAICRKVLGEEHPSTATSYNNLGGVYYSKGEYPQAIEYFQTALSILKKNFPDGHPHIDMVSESLRRARGKRG